VKGGQLFVMIYRTEYWQCAYLIPKGGFDAIKADGLSKFRARLKGIAGFAAERVDDAIVDFDQVKLLTVVVDRLTQWARPGLQCIGDAAHAMSPIGGVGINLAVQDAVATANILGPVLKRGPARERDLALVQKRRMWPTKMTQAMQIQIQKRLVTRVLAGGGGGRAPLFFRLFNHLPLLRRIPARFIGMGFRPEHIVRS
jgi:2-polyprenyl-6-methoxyphenol hydroxylase-like FAD-dependent oxidoreductase